MIRIYESDELFKDFPKLLPQRENIEKGANMMLDCYNAGGKILICGNGGSAADSDHIVGELMKGFLLSRRMGEAEAEKFNALFPKEDFPNSLQRGIPAVALTTTAALNTAFANDEKGEYVFAQSVYSLARKGDMLIAISTSGNSKSVCLAVKVAKVLGIPVLALTGRDGGELIKLADTTVLAPANETYKIQQYHLPVYHKLCIEAENAVFGK